MYDSPYEHVHWGSFTKEFNRRKPEYRGIPDLHSFAVFILNNPEKFSERSRKRAQFYRSLVEKHGKSYGGSLHVDLLKQFIENSYRNDQREIGPFMIDNALSTKEVQLWVSESLKRMVMVVRGTEGTLRDWSNNAVYLTGQYKKTKRFQRANKIMEEALAKYQGFRLTVVGHSQGGILSHLLSNPRIFEKIHYNPGWTTEKMEPNEYIVRTSGDAVSMFSPKSDHTTVIPSKTSNPIHEHSTIPLEDLPPKMDIGRGGAIDIMKMTKKELIAYIHKYQKK